MRIFRFLTFFGCLVVLTAVSAHAQASPTDAMRACKNTASERMPYVPLAYINVSRGSDEANGSYMINFRAQPPGGQASSGFCVVSKNGQVQRFQFDPGSGGGGNHGGGNPGVSGQDAMRTCKNIAGERLPRVPLAYINVYQGSNTGNGSFMINFHAQPPGGPSSSGFCIISRSGQMQNFQFDPNSGSNTGNGGGGGNNYGGQTNQDAMRSCKSAVSQRLPSVPLAFIEVNPPTVNGGSLLVKFRAMPPNGYGSSGACDVFKNGRVNLMFDNR